MFAAPEPSPTPARLVGGTLLLAGAYMLAGGLGLLLAVPPGYATALWPPTGIALAGVLILGRRAAWGVWLGSFGVNLWAAWTGGNLGWNGAFLAACLGGGAAAGALVGAHLLAGDPEWSMAFDRRGDLLRFLGLGAPVMCLITATWGVGCLVAFGAAAWTEAPFNWLTWWGGDLLGALVFTPLGLMGFGHPRALWAARRIPVGLPLVGAFLLTSLFFGVACREMEARRAQERDEIAGAVTAQLDAGLRAQAAALDAVAAYFAARPQIDVEAFRVFARAIRPHGQGVAALGWAPFLSQAQVRALEASAARSGLQGYRVMPAPPSEEVGQDLSPLLFLEPQGARGFVLGQDLRRDAAAAAAVEAARRAGGASVVGNLPAASGKASFLLLRLAKGPGGAESLVPGLLVAPVDAQAFLREEMGGLSARARGVRVSLWDGPGPSAHLLASLQEENGRWQNGPPLPRGQTSRPVPVGGAQWRLEVSPPPAVGRDGVPWAVLSLGSLFTGLLAAQLLLLTGRGCRAGTPGEGDLA